MGGVAAFPLAAAAAGSWTETAALPGAYVPSVAYNADGSMLYAGGIGVVFRSANEGESWTASPLPVGYQTSQVVGIAASLRNKNLVLASTQDIGLGGAAGDAVFASSDGGKTWKPGAGLSNQVSAGNSQYPYYPVWDPKTTDTAYAGTAGAGGDGAVFRTTNAGKSWAMVFEPHTTSDPFPLGPILAVPSNPVSLYLSAGRFDYSTSHEGFVAKSRNGGASSSFVNDLGNVGLPGYGQVLTVFGHDPKNPAIVYTLATGYNDGTLDNFQYLRLFWTPNGGTNWVERVSGLPKTAVGSALAVDPAGGAVLLPLCCAPHHELYRSVNEGKTWSHQGTIPASSSVLAARPGLSAKAPAILASAGHGGVMVSSDGGKSWANENAGLDQPVIADIVADPAKTTLFYVATRAGVQRTGNGGKSFVEIDQSGLSDLNIQALALDAAAAKHVLYAATNSGVFRCENPTAAKPVWTEITPAAAGGRFGTFAIAVDDAKAGRLYVSTNLHFAPREIYRSDDFGVHWATTAFHTVSGNDIPEAMIADPKTPGTLYAVGGVLGTIYKSTNAGKSFTQIFGAVGSKFFWGQKSALNPRTLYLLSTNANSGKPQILRSTNGGKTWDSSTDAAPGGGALLDIAADPGSSRLYALVALLTKVGNVQEYTLSLFASPNRGFSWTGVKPALPVLPLTVFTGLTTLPTLRATGDTLAVAAPLSAHLLRQSLAALR
ncbi:MAG TPA: hypothetical protein VGF34_17745 [Stellaceae bacterium]